jgi:hypothetical protein
MFYLGLHRTMSCSPQAEAQSLPASQAADWGWELQMQLLPSTR